MSRCAERFYKTSRLLGVWWFPSFTPPFFFLSLFPLFFLSRVAHTFAVVDWTWSLMTRFTRRKPVLVQHHFIIPHINGSIPTRAMLSLMSRDRLSHLIKCQEIWFWPPIQPRVLVKCDVLLHQSYYRSPQQSPVLRFIDRHRCQNDNAIRLTDNRRS